MEVKQDCLHGLIMRNWARHKCDCCQEIRQSRFELPHGKVTLTAERDDTPAQVRRYLRKNQRINLCQRLPGLMDIKQLRGAGALIFKLMEFARLRFQVATLLCQQG